MNGGRSYHVLATIGRGGFGTVFLARVQGDGGFSKIVALKMLNADVAGREEVARRMRDEARVLGLVRHRAIVQVDSLVRLDGQWTVVMEYIEGADLRSLLKISPIPPGPALEIAGEVASALHAVYYTVGAEGPLRLLHRDIKPGNIRLTPLGEVKILDFGIARADFDSRESSTQGVMVGTPEYMAPERFSLLEGPAGDVYALGAVLFEMLTGETLGRTVPNPERHADHLERAIYRLGQHPVVGQDPELVAFLTSLLAFEADKRPSAREMERQCTALRTRYQDLNLRDWAEEVVPPLVDQRVTPPPEEIAGSTLIEQSEPDAATWAGSFTGHRPQPLPDPLPGHARPGLSGEFQPTRPLSREIAPVVPTREDWQRKEGMGFFGRMAWTALLLLATATAGAWMAVRMTGPGAPPPPDDGFVGMVSEPEIYAAHTVVSKDDPPLVKPPDPATLPKEPAVQHPTPVDPPVPVAQPVSKGTIMIEGDATRVVLLSGTERYTVPGEIPSGSYSIEAAFPGRGVVPAGTVKVAAESVITLTCKEAFGRCR